MEQPPPDQPSSSPRRADGDEGAEARERREREFHDRAYSEDVRSRTAGFYAVSGPAFEWYEELLRAGPGDTVLEIGCGEGSYAYDLARRGARVLAIDVSQVAIDLTRERAAREGLTDLIEPRMMNAEQLEVGPATFDLVCGTGVLHHLDLGRAYAEIARTLRPGGTAVFLEPLGHNPLVNLYRRLTPGLRTEDEHPLLMPDLEEARAFFRRVGLRFFSLTALGAIALRRPALVARAAAPLAALDRRVFRLLPAARRHAWLVVVRLEAPRPPATG